jgi:hypothetical protein
LVVTRIDRHVESVVHGGGILSLAERALVARLPILAGLGSPLLRLLPEEVLGPLAEDEASHGQIL